MRLLVVVAALLVVVAPAERMGKNFAFLCDVSGSMDGPKIQAAIGGYAEIAAQATDEMQMRVVAFDRESYAWRKEWTSLPDAEAVDAAMTWLYAQGRHGGTLCGPALEAALRDTEEDLTVVLITDGQFYAEHTHELLARIERAQKARKRRAVIAVVYIGADAKPPAVLRKLAAAGRGGLYRF